MTGSPGKSSASRRICYKCVGNGALSQQVRSDGDRGRCQYCSGVRKTVPVTRLAELIDPVFREHYSMGPLVTRYDAESDRGYDERDGEELEWILQEEAGIDAEPAADLARVLEESDDFWPGDGEERFYDRQETYVEHSLAPWEYTESWTTFSRLITHEARFFDPRRAELLEHILGAPGSTQAEELPAFEVGPGTAVECVFRARLARSADELLDIHRSPGKNLGPPPSNRGFAARMNADGISVFYGALSLDTAIAEVRPSVGSRVVVGKFRATRVLRLLNLPSLGAAPGGSIFDSGYDDRADRLRFLARFHAVIARPIQAGDEPLSYLPTQAVAEFVCNVLGFDGLLYASAQVGAVRLDELSWDDAVESTELSEYNVAVMRSGACVAQAEDGPVADPAESPSANFEYIAGSAEACRITAIRYSHEPEYVHDGKAHTKF